MEAGSPILSTVSKLLENCGASSERWQIVSLLKDIAAELSASGESVETEADIIREVALMIAALRSRYGLESDIDSIEEELKKAIEMEKLLRAPLGIRGRLRARRRGRGLPTASGGVLS